MSQFYVVSVNGTPSVPTEFQTQVGGPAVPQANVLIVSGDSSSRNVDDGIYTDGSNVGEVDIVLSNTLFGSGQTTDGTTTVELIDFSLPIEGTYIFTGDVVAFNETDGLSSCYAVACATNYYSGITTEIGNEITSNFVQTGMETVQLNFTTTVANNFLLGVIGIAGKTINYKAYINYRYVGA